MKIHMNLGADSYDILVERGVLSEAKKHLNLNRRVLIVTDTGVPAEYAETLAALQWGKVPRVSRGLPACRS